MAFRLASTAWTLPTLPPIAATSSREALDVLFALVTDATEEEDDDRDPVPPTTDFFLCLAALLGTESVETMYRCKASPMTASGLALERRESNGSMYLRR